MGGARTLDDLDLDGAFSCAVVSFSPDSFDGAVLPLTGDLERVVLAAVVDAVVRLGDFDLVVVRLRTVPLSFGASSRRTAPVLARVAAEGVAGGGGEHAHAACGDEALRTRGT